MDCKGNLRLEQDVAVLGSKTIAGVSLRVEWSKGGEKKCDLQIGKKTETRKFTFFCQETHF